MNGMIKPGLLTAAALCAMPTTSLHAQTADTCYYWGLGLGMGVGQSRLRIDDQPIRDVLATQSLVTTATSHDECHVGYKAFVGYQFNRCFGTELGFFDLGKFGCTASTTPSGSLNSSFRVQGANLGIVRTMPLSENFSEMARVGAYYARTRANVLGAGPGRWSRALALCA